MASRLRRKKRDKGRATWEKFGKYRPSRGGGDAPPAGASQEKPTWVPRQAGKPRQKSRRPVVGKDDVRAGARGGRGVVGAGAPRGRRAERVRRAAGAAPPPPPPPAAPSLNKSASYWFGQGASSDPRIVRSARPENSRPLARRPPAMRRQLSNEGIALLGQALALDVAPRDTGEDQFADFIAYYERR